MAAPDTLGCIAAIVSAFQSGADLFQGIRDRQTKKRRMKENDWERAVEEKLLQKSLLDAAVQCQNVSGEKCRQHGAAFVNGDTVAMSELKNVMVTLQTEVISALQIARAVQNATLDLLALHEVVVVGKANVLRAMHELCERLTTPSLHSPLQSPSPRSRHSLHTRTSSGISIPQAVSMPPPGIPERSPARMLSRLQLTDAFPKRSLTKSLRRRSSTWFAKTRHLDDDAQVDADMSVNRTSMHDSALGSSVADGGKQLESNHDLDEKRLSCTTAESFEDPEDFYNASPTRSSWRGHVASYSPSPMQWESPDSLTTVSHVAVAASMEARPVSTPKRASQHQPSSPQSIHPAFRNFV
ncbi:hypothetical protein PRZ48_014959 [Zasmidium cellare]|uniref:Fungal N-terminal domain-containing protein n=1 Tax=Zasmidium cellare TaxID=395010 RepID=A0ABR0DX96_ZASCE|nr:hypothetical protein PRZ48_014959 [Zasmidium cellare]